MDEPKKKNNEDKKQKVKKKMNQSQDKIHKSNVELLQEKKYWLSYRPIHKTSQTFMTYEYKYMPQKKYLYMYTYRLDEISRLLQSDI